MPAYINRERLMAFPIRRDNYDMEHGDTHFINGVETVMEYAESLPAEDVAPVIHARWVHKVRKVYHEDGSYTLALDGYCSACEWWIAEGMDSPFCPRCGARMDGTCIDQP